MRTKKRIEHKIEEPIFDANSIVPKESIIKDNQYRLAKLFNWYNSNCKAEKGRDWFLSYAKEKLSEKEYDLFCAEKYFSLPYCWLARQAKLTTLPKKIQRILDEHVSQLSISAMAKNSAIEQKKRTKNVKSIQDHIKDQTASFVSVVDFSFDDWIDSDYKKVFDLESYLTQHEVKQIHIPKIIERLEFRKSEFESALSGEDEQLKEAYSLFGKSKLRKMIEYLDNQIEILKNHKEVAKIIAKKIRKPRLTKKNPLKSVLKLQYKKEDTTYNLKSINPVDIIDTDQLWIFNTKTRLLGVYRTSNVHGLFVKGSTIRNFNANISIGKTIRKPDVVLPKLLSAGKVELKHTLDKIKAAEKKLNGRINKDCILLRVE